MSAEPAPLVAQPREAQPDPGARPDGYARGLKALGALAVNLRPHQWVKNLLVFGGLIFSKSLTESGAIVNSLLAFVLFCCASSAVYLLNDLRDLEEDRKHPGKRRRPLARGILNPRLVGSAQALLLAIALVGAFLLRPAFGVVIALYLVNGIGYSLGLKRLVIADVMLIALGFVLRAVGGAVAIDVTASPWLIVCTMMLALVVGFGKRRHELVLLDERAGAHRATLDHYSVAFLDSLVNISAAAAVVSYVLYTMDGETIHRVGSGGLLLSVPWVIYGIFRYLYLVQEKHEGGDPALLLVSDRATVFNAAMWLLTVLMVIYSPLPRVLPKQVDPLEAPSSRCESPGSVR